MATITLAQICNAIKTTLATAAEVDVSQSYNELTEAVVDQKLLQVYPDSGQQDPSGSTDRTTFQAKVRQTSITILVDYYAKQRSNLGEDMAQLVDGIDAITNVFEAQDTKPYFGLDGIRAFSWSWQRATFEYGDPLQRLIGARFTIILRIF